MGVVRSLYVLRIYLHKSLTFGKRTKKPGTEGAGRWRISLEGGDFVNIKILPVSCLREAAVVYLCSR
jgi:hypothetical protein